MKTLISVLGADLWFKDGRWQTQDLDAPGDHSGVTLDRWRVIAGSYLFEKDPTSTLLAQGGLATADRPSLASVIRDELVELGIPPQKISLEETSHSSYSQLVELQRVALKEGPKKIFIISNEWHLPRLQAMVEVCEALAPLRRLDHQFVAAEEILLREHPTKWKEIVKETRVRADIAARIQKEHQGVEQIRNGTYQFR
ncbi:MAG: YdcF family protein [Patescibacteria group bacterium]